MKNIIFVTNSLGFGGAEKMLTFVAGALADRGHNCTIINLNGVPDYVNTQRQSVSDKVKVFETKCPSGDNKNLYSTRKIIEIAKLQKANVIVAFTEYPNMYAKLASAKLGIPSIMSERGDPSRTSGGGIKSKLAKFLVNRSKGGVFQTGGAMAYYGRGLRKRGIVIPNPIFIKGEIPEVCFDDREKSVVSVGRLDNEQKRYDVMLEAFAIFSKKHPDYVLKLYGRGGDEEEIKQWVIDLGLADKVHFMGLTSTPMQDIAKDGIFLITSDYEGISNSLLEAMAVGLPCVSTDHTPGGARLLIQDHENGLLAPIQDSEELARAMCEFAEDKELAKSCGEKAKEVTTRFAPDKIIDMWENYIRKIVKD